MTVRRPLACLVLLAFGLLTAFATACGGGGDDERALLGERRAASMRDDLDKIADYVSAGRCDAARDRLDSLRAKVNDLPQRTDPDLRDRLTEGVAHLEQISPEECRDNDDTQTTETTETVPETTPETVPPPTATEPPPTQTTPPPTETQPPPQTEPAPAPEQPDVEPAPDDSGGEEAPGGASFPPPGQAKKGDG
jgi:hypothetical protein